MDRIGLNYQLIVASIDGDINAVKYLIEDGANVNWSDSYGYTPLIFASRERHLEIVKYLVEKGANVNHGNNQGTTPLIFASRDGHFDIVKYLVEHGANVNQSDNNGYPPLSWASNHEYLDIIKYLVSHNADYSSIMNQPIFQDIIISESNKLKNKLTERYGLVKHIPGHNLPKDALLRTIYEEPYQNYCNPSGTGLPPIQLIALANILNNTLPKKRGLIEYGGKFEPIDLHLSWSDLCKKVKQALYLLL